MITLIKNEENMKVKEISTISFIASYGVAYELQANNEDSQYIDYNDLALLAILMESKNKDILVDLSENSIKHADKVTNGGLTKIDIYECFKVRYDFDYSAYADNEVVNFIKENMYKSNTDICKELGWGKTIK